MTTAWPRSSAAPLPNSSRCPPSPSTTPARTSRPPTWSSSRLILVYVAIMATKLVRIEREITELSEIVERREAAREPEEERV